MRFSNIILALVCCHVHIDSRAEFAPPKIPPRATKERKAVELQIETLSRETLEDALSKLAQEEAYSTHLVLRSTGSIRPDLFLDAVLSSRRFSQVVELLEDYRGENKLESILTETYKSYFESFKRKLDRTVATFKDRSKVTLGPREVGPGDKLGEKKMALIACLFLTSWVGDLESAVVRSREVSQFCQSHLKNLESELKGAGMEYDTAVDLLGFAAYLDWDVYGNVCLLAVSNLPQQSKGALTTADWDALNGIRRELRKDFVELVPWKSVVISSDRLHLVHGLPVSKHGEKLVVYRGFSKELVFRTWKVLEKAKRNSKSKR